ncbi:uncharacterized protein, partial [Blastocystis hominis]
NTWFAKLVYFSCNKKLMVQTTGSIQDVIFELFV